MTALRSLLRSRAAWLVPVATAAVVGGAVVVPMAASADPTQLKPMSPAQLIAAVEQSDVTALSGRISETADLGLPALPGSGQNASFSLPALLAGTHEATVAIDGPQRQRFALLGTLAESDVVHNGTDVWTYSSHTGQVTHLVLPPHSRSGRHTPDPADPTNLNPQAMAQKALDAITPTTGVSVGEATDVAGRDAYTLVLTPEQHGSTIGKVVIAIDAHRFVPLRVEVYGAGSKPVVRSGFTSISYRTPDATTFDFTPPAGSTVTTRTPGESAGQHPDSATTGSAAPSGARPQVLGSGWTSVVEIPLGTAGLGALAPAGQGQGDHSPTALLDRLFKTQSNGDRLMRTNLVNALLTSDGRLFVGAVHPSVLQAAAKK